MNPIPKPLHQKAGSDLTGRNRLFFTGLALSVSIRDKTLFFPERRHSGFLLYPHRFIVFQNKIRRLLYSGGNLLFCFLPALPEKLYSSF